MTQSRPWFHQGFPAESRKEKKERKKKKKRKKKIAFTSHA